MLNISIKDSKMVNHQKNTKNLTPWDKIWRLALAIALPLGGGFIISLFTRDAMAKFSTFNQPPLSPPGWLSLSPGPSSTFSWVSLAT